MLAHDAGDSRSANRGHLIHSTLWRGKILPAAVFLIVLLWWGVQPLQAAQPIPDRSPGPRLEVEPPADLSPQEIEDKSPDWVLAREEESQKDTHKALERAKQGDAASCLEALGDTFSPEERRLAFAHWDVEGAEPDLLAGAVDVIHRDRPLFTVETHSVHMAREHSQVMQLLNEYHYTAMEIMEVCGGWTDCRNWLCVPSERLPELRAKLPPTTLSLLGESPSTRAREAPFDAWLGSLREGYCAPTRDNSGDCTGGDKGSMRLSAEAAWSFRSSAAECARRCLDCERCRYISFSVGFRDCSWYALRPKAVQWRASRLAA